MIRPVVYQEVSGTGPRDDVMQVSVVWLDSEQETSFCWGVVKYISSENVKRSEDITRLAKADMPAAVADFISMFNNTDTREEAKVLFALGGIESMHADRGPRIFTNASELLDFAAQQKRMALYLLLISEDGYKPAHASHLVTSLADESVRVSLFEQKLFRTFKKSNAVSNS